MVQLQTEIVKAAKALNKGLPSTAAQTGTYFRNQNRRRLLFGQQLCPCRLQAERKRCDRVGGYFRHKYFRGTGSVSGTTLTVSVPTANLNGSGNWKVKLTKTATANVETMLAYQISGNTANQRLVMLDTIAVKRI